MNQHPVDQAQVGAPPVAPAPREPARSSTRRHPRLDPRRELHAGPWRRPLLLAAFAAASAAGALLYLPAAGAAAVLATTGVVAALVACIDRLRRRVVASCATGLLGLAGVDLVLRRVRGRRLHYRPFHPLVRRGRDDSRPLRFAPDVDERRTVHGDLAALSGDPSLRQPRSVRFRTDGAGFRNAGLPTRPVDVVLLGDAFGLGEGTSQEDTWASHLARTGREVVNLSMPGGAGREALTFASEARRLHLHPGSVVVWAVLAGDDLWDDHPEWDAPLIAQAWPAELLEEARVGSPLRLLASGPRSAPADVLRRELGGQPFLFFRPQAERADLGPEQLRARQRRGRMRDAMRRMRALSRAHGVRVLVAIVPSKAEVYADALGRPLAAGPTPFAQLAREDAAAEGLPVVDLMPALLAARRGEGEPLWWRDDTRWSPSGHRVAAASVLAALAELPPPTPTAE